MFVDSSRSTWTRRSCRTQPCRWRFPSRNIRCFLQLRLRKKRQQHRQSCERKVWRSLHTWHSHHPHRQCCTRYRQLCILQTSHRASRHNSTLVRSRYQTRPCPDPCRWIDTTSGCCWSSCTTRWRAWSCLQRNIRRTRRSRWCSCQTWLECSIR